MTEPNKGKILIVDDEESLLIIYKKLLSAAGYDVITATNGAEAAEMAKKHQPQLVLLDVILPDISGTEVLKIIKNQPETAQSFVVLISSKLVSSENQSDGLESGADGYLQKPIQNRELIARVDAFMRHKTTIDSLVKSEERFRKIVQKNADGILIADAGGIIRFANPQAEKMFGKEKGGLTGSNFGHPVIRGESTEVDISRKNSEAGTSEMRAVEIFWEGESATLISLRDISERKLAKERVDKSEENLRVTLNSIGDAVIATDTEGSVIRMNSIAESLTGWKLTDVGGQPLEKVFQIKNAFTGVKAENPVSKVLKTGVIVGLANHTKLVSKNGKEFQIADSAAPIKNDEGKIIGVVLVFRDVTEEYRMQEKLKSSEELYRLLVENQTDLVVKVDAESRFLYVSPSYCKLFEKTEDELLGKTFMPLVHEDDREPTARAMEKLSLPPYTTYIEQRAMTAKGWVWLAWNDTAIVDEKGNIKEIIGVGRDITPRKIAEEKLAHSLELMSYVIEHANSAVAVHDRDLKYIYVSQRYLDQFKVKEKDVIGRHHYDVFPDLPQKWRDVHKKALRGEVSKAERDPYYRDDGTVVWTRWECRPWYEDGGSIGGFIIYTEVITERIEAENTLRESERRLSTLMNNLPGMAYRCINNNEWTMEFVSSGCLPLTGYSQPQLQNNTAIAYGELIHPDDRKYVWEEVQAANREKRSFVAEYRITGKNGIEKWVWEKGRAVNDKHLEGFIMDITIRKKAEMELKEKISELEKFNRAMVGRENRMIELKQEINDLLLQAGKEKKYKTPGDS